jgi:hypothetical protein
MAADDNHDLKDSPEYAVAERFSASDVSDITPIVRRLISRIASLWHPGL